MPWGFGPCGPFRVRVVRLSSIRDVPSEWVVQTMGEARRMAWREVTRGLGVHSVSVSRIRKDAEREVFCIVFRRPTSDKEGTESDGSEEAFGHS